MKQVAELEVSRKTLLSEALSGLVMAVVSVPGALANGVLAGVNPVCGLYSLIAGTTVAALFTSSVIMNVDSTGATALAVSDAFEGLELEQHITYLVVLALLVGVFQITFGLLRLGFLTRLISNAVMTGFLTGIAALTILGQLGDLTGFHSEVGNRVLRAFDTLKHFRSVDLPSLGVGFITIATIYSAGRVKALSRYSFPLALVVATLTVFVLRLDSVTVVGDSTQIPRSLPAVHLPEVSLLPKLVIPAFAIAVISLAQGAGVSQSSPNPDGEYPDASGDFVGQGAGNLAVGFVGGLPVGGSLSGTALIRNCGGQSRWANIFTGAFAALTVLLAARMIEWLPMPALAGLLVMVGIEMFKPHRIWVAWHTGLLPRAMMAITFAATLTVQLQYAILFGVALHIVLHVIRSARRVRIERIVPTTNNGFREAPVPKTISSGEVFVLQPVGDLFFAGAAELEEDLPDIGDAHHSVVVIRLRDRDEVGSTFIRVVDRYAKQLQINDCQLMLEGLNRDVFEQLERTGVIDAVGRQNVFLAEPQFGSALMTAIETARQWIDSKSDQETTR